MKRNYFLKWLILALVLGMSVNGMAQYDGEGLYTIQRVNAVNTTRYISINPTSGANLPLLATVNDNAKFYIKVNPTDNTKFNIISFVDDRLLANNNTQGVWIENTETNRNNTTGGALVSISSVGTAGTNPYYFASTSGTDTKRWNGNRDSNIRVGMGPANSTTTGYHWTLVKIGGLPGESVPAATTLTTPPTAGQRIVASTAFALKATASAGTGNTISKVEFYEGSNLLGEGTLVGDDYVYDWTPTTAGTYSITSKVTDTGAQTATSAAANLIVVDPKVSPVKSVHIDFEDVDIATDWFNESTNSTLSIVGGKGIGGSKALAITQTATGAQHAYSLRAADKVYLNANEYLHIIASVATSDVVYGQPMLSFRRDDWTGPTPTTIAIPDGVNNTFATRTFSRNASTLDNYMDWSPRTRTNISSIEGVNTVMYYDNMVMYASSITAVDLVAPEAATDFSVNTSTKTIGWTAGTDAATGIQKTYILRTTNSSAADPVIAAQAAYKVDASIGDWRVIAIVDAGTSSYIDATGTADNKYAIIHRDLAYNNSVALVGSASYTNTEVTTNTNLSDIADCETCDVVVKNGAELTINANRTISNLTIEPGAKVTLTGSNALTVSNALSLQNTDTQTSSFVDSRTDDNPTPIAGLVSQTVTATDRNWYVAAPVSGKTASNITLSGAKIVKRNEATASWEDVNGSLDAGVGYIAVASTSTGTTTWNLSGNLNSGKVEVAVTRSGASSVGFNLLGNPYPSYLNWEQVLNLNETNESLLQPSIWYRTANWNSDLNKYDYTFNTYNSVGRVATPTSTTGYIPPMQAFWVRANSAGTVTFTNAMRSHGNGSINMLKAPKAVTQKIVRLQVTSTDNVGDETVIYFDENAQNTLDKYDTPKMFNNIARKPELYTNADGEDLVINGLRSIDEVSTLNIGFKTGQSNTFSIKATEIANLNANKRVILKDNDLDTELDITDGAAYSFTSDATNTASRFSLVFRTPSFTTGFATQQLSMSIVKNANQQLIVNSGSSEKGRINIYNALGQKVKTLPTTGNSTLIDQQFETGVYILHLEVGTSKATQKIIIK